MPTDLPEFVTCPTCKQTVPPTKPQDVCGETCSTCGHMVLKAGEFPLYDIHNVKPEVWWKPEMSNTNLAVAAPSGQTDAVASGDTLVINGDQVVEAMLIAYGAPAEHRDALRGRMRNLARGTRHCIDEADQRAQAVARALGVTKENA